MAGNATSCGELDSVGPGPFTDLTRVPVVRRAPPLRSSAALHTSPRPPCRVNVISEPGTKPLRIRIREIDLVGDTVQPELNGLDFVRRRTVEVVDELNKNLLSHQSTLSDTETDHTIFEYAETVPA